MMLADKPTNPLFPEPGGEICGESYTGPTGIVWLCVKKPHPVVVKIPALDCFTPILPSVHYFINKKHWEEEHR